ncbi:ArnT family glycosyltransferase [Hyella patelloides]|uniref:ArnT family glycosyltransferase n=1 Tax=Hyella patelloides TaxID=1982969 RepID=UPI001C94A8DA|nr:glycosyltransferase family 39 protein [Hyella patelloides]
MSAFVVVGVFIVTTTEILSLVSLFNFVAILLAWSLFNLGLLVTIVRQKYHRETIADLTKAIYLLPQQLSWFLASLLLGIIIVIALIGVIAVVAPPNTWDSMTYHMSRVMHWIQNGSVAHYPTYNLPQLFHPPFAEFSITHLQILSKSDRFANLIQWFSAIGSAIGVSLIAKELNADQRGQVFTVVFAATIPMGILQASSTQNDYVVTFWLVCLAYYVLLSFKTQEKRYIFWFIGASLGLGILTKSSAYLYGFPFMVWFSLIQLWRYRWRWHAWQTIGFTTAIAIILNVGHYWRNFELFNSFLGTPKNFAVAYKIEVISFPTFLSNVIRNMGLHLDIIRTLRLEQFITPITGIANKLILLFHDLIGVDMFDPRTTAQSYSGIPGISFDENVAGNPLHLFIIFSVIFYFLLRKKLRRDRHLLTYQLVTIACFFMLCLMLKIQAYQSRHHLAIFIFFAPVVGIILSHIPLQKLANTIAILLIVTSLPWVLQNKFRPIAAEANIFNLSRIEQYFINRPQLQKPYVQAAQTILTTECKNIGLSLGEGTSVGNEYWEYPFWVLLKKSQPQIHIENVNAQNISLSKAEKYPHNNFAPCAIIAVRNLKVPQIESMIFKNRLFTTTMSSPPVKVLIPK